MPQSIEPACINFILFSGREPRQPVFRNKIFEPILGHLYGAINAQLIRFICTRRPRAPTPALSGDPQAPIPLSLLSAKMVARETVLVE
jgi:hypothetical protein